MNPIPYFHFQKQFKDFKESVERQFGKGKYKTLVLRKLYKFIIYDEWTSKLNKINTTYKSEINKLNGILSFNPLTPLDGVKIGIYAFINDYNLDQPIEKEYLILKNEIGAELYDVLFGDKERIGAFKLKVYDDMQSILLDNHLVSMPPFSID